MKGLAQGFWNSEEDPRSASTMILANRTGSDEQGRKRVTKPRGRSSLPLVDEENPKMLRTRFWASDRALL